MKPERIAGIYTIWCEPTDRVYIGSTVDIRKRWIEHRGMLTRGSHENSRLQADWDEHGAAAFEFEIAETIQHPSGRALVEAEQRWLDSFDLAATYHRRPRVLRRDHLSRIPSARYWEGRFQRPTVRPYTPGERVAETVLLSSETRYMIDTLSTRLEVQPLEVITLAIQSLAAREGITGISRSDLNRGRGTPHQEASRERPA